MDITQILGIILTSSVISSFFMYAINSKKDKRDDYTTIISNYRTEFELKVFEIETLRGESKANTSIIVELQTEIKELRLLIEQHKLLEPAHYALPLPFWIKDREGRLLYVNDAYNNEYLLPNEHKLADCIGKTEFEIWGESLGTLYKKGDDLAKQRGGMVVLNEHIMIKCKKSNLLVVKYPINIGSINIGTAGISIDAGLVTFSK